MGAYFASLNFASLPARMPSAIAQGILWGLMALGVYITFRLLDVADLSVDGSFATGGAVTVMLIIAGWPAWAALLAALLVGVLAGLCTGLLHTKLGIPAILAGILTQFALYSVNLRIMGMKANQTASLKTYGMFWENGGKGFLISSRYVPQAIGIGFLLALGSPESIMLFHHALHEIVYAHVPIYFIGVGNEKGRNSGGIIAIFVKIDIVGQSLGNFGTVNHEFASQ